MRTFLLLSMIVVAGCTTRSAPSESIGALLATIDGREWDGLAGAGKTAVPIRGSAACKADGLDYRCSLIDTVGEGEGAITVALVLEFHEDGRKLDGTLEDIGPGGQPMMKASVSGTRRGRKLSFETIEAVTAAGTIGVAFLELDLDTAPRFSFAIGKSADERKTIIAGTFR